MKRVQRDGEMCDVTLIDPDVDRGGEKTLERFPSLIGWKHSRIKYGPRHNPRDVCDRVT